MQGRIACCNVLSDLYSMGVEHIDTILMVLGISLKMNEQEREVITGLMMQGFEDCAKDANTSVTGGQTVFNPWPIIGGVGIAAVSKDEFSMPNYATKGCHLVMTKALGTQVAVNAIQWKGQKNQTNWQKLMKVVTEQQVVDAYNKCEQSMATLSMLGARLLKKYKAKACTDITGFGVQGHAQFLASCQKDKVDLLIHSLPIYKDLVKMDKVIHDFKLIEGYSAETSGGLLICLEQNQAKDFVQEMQDNGHIANIVGEVTSGSNKAIIQKNPHIIEI